MSLPTRVAATTGTSLGIRLYPKEDSLTLADATKVLTATKTLLAEIEKSITGKKRARIKWQVVGIGYECDGCGTARPSEHPDWTHTEEGKDYCQSCWEITQIPKPETR